MRDGGVWTDPEEKNPNSWSVVANCTPAEREIRNSLGRVDKWVRVEVEGEWRTGQVVDTMKTGVIFAHEACGQVAVLWRNLVECKDHEVLNAAKTVTCTYSFSALRNSWF